MMSVNQLRNELKARSVNSKGLKSQLVARLSKALKNEAEKIEDENKEGPVDVESDSTDEKKVEVLHLHLTFMIHPVINCNKYFRQKRLK